MTEFEWATCATPFQICVWSESLLPFDAVGLEIGTRIVLLADRRRGDVPVVGARLLGLSGMRLG